MAHTQGPWTVQEQQSRFGVMEGYYVIYSDRVQVADLFGIFTGKRDEDGNDVFISADESAANARLIAAAPDLLDIARELYRYETDPDYREQREMDASAASDGNVSYLDALTEKLAAAIAKAEGGA